MRWRQPKVALEIGVETGLASAYMVKGVKDYDGFVIGIDLTRPRRKPSKNYYFVQGDSTDKSVWSDVYTFCNQVGKIGVVFQDSSHHYQASKEEWRLYSQLLDTNAIWICDDITPSFWDWRVDPPGKGMVQYFEELPGDKRLYPDVLHYGNTFGIVLL